MIGALRTLKACRRGAKSTPFLSARAERNRVEPGVRTGALHSAAALARRLHIRYPRSSFPTANRCAGFAVGDRGLLAPQHGGAEVESADARNATHINVHCISGWLTWYVRTHVRVRCAPHFKPFDRSASCREIQKGGSPFGRFKGFPKGENEIPLWRAFFAALPRFFPTTGKKWGNIPCTALRIVLRYFPHQSPPATASPGGGSLCGCGALLNVSGYEDGQPFGCCIFYDRDRVIPNRIFRVIRTPLSPRTRGALRRDAWR